MRGAEYLSWPQIQKAGWLERWFALDANSVANGRQTDQPTRHNCLSDRGTEEGNILSGL